MNNVEMRKKLKTFVLNDGETHLQRPKKASLEVDISNKD